MHEYFFLQCVSILPTYYFHMMDIYASSHSVLGVSIPGSSADTKIHVQFPTQKGVVFAHDLCPSLHLFLNHL